MSVAYLTEVGDAQHKADGVENIGLSCAIEAGDGVELGIERTDHCALCVRLEAVKDNFLWVEMRTREQHSEHQQHEGGTHLDVHDSSAENNGFAKEL